MKIKKLVLFALLAGGIFASCNKQPSAGFTMDNNTPIIGERVYFTSETINGSTYEWDFGDGYKSTGETSSHVYNESGTFTVTLTAFSWNEKKSDSFSKSLTVSVPTYEYMTNKWDFESQTSANYVNGDLESEGTYYPGDFYDSYTIEFFDDYTYQTNADGSITDGSWTLDVANNTFSVDGLDYDILDLTLHTFNYSNTESTTVDGDTYLETSIVRLTR